MPAIKLQKFLGTAPRISPELLPDMAGQVAYNLQMYSGDLIPYPETFVVYTVPRLGEIQTIFGMRETPSSDITWLTWLEDVDIATITESTDDEQRFYYTGDGVPKVTTFALATSGSEPYPNTSGFFELGLPLPTVAPVATAASAITANTASFRRDSGNTAIITTDAPHGFRDGNIVTVRGFTGATPEAFNVVNTRITVTSTTTFEYFNSGATVATTANTNGIVDLSGSTVTRDYTYTWYTPWDEESIGSDPSDTLFIKEGQQVTITGLPTAAPAGDNFITGMKLYRTLSSASGNEFFHLSTLLFPLALSTVARASNVVTVVTSLDHSLIVDDRFKIAGCSDSTFDIIDGVVLSVANATTFTFAQTDSDVSVKAETAGKVYYDVSEIPDDDPARYWGDDTLTTATRARANGVVTLTTATAHNMTTNQTISISDMTDSSYDESAATITVVDTTTFTYVGTGGVATSLRERTSNVTTMTTGSDHGFSTSDVVTITGMTDDTFDEEGVTITVTGATTFTYPNTGTNETSASDTGGLVRVDEASTADTAGTILNDSYVDDFSFLNLVDRLVSDDFDKPNAAMVGIKAIQNSMVVGFFDNQLCFAEPGKPWAWPLEYRRTFEYDIVAIETIGGFLVVLTTDYAYRVTGNDPATISISRIDTPYPCLSKQSVVNMGYGVMFATHGGLALWSATGQLAMATMAIHDWDTWDNKVDPSTVVGHFYNDKYYGSHSTGAFLFQREEGGGGFYTTAGHRFNSAWTDVTDNSMYTSSDLVGNITEWGSTDYVVRPMEWKSKVIIVKDYINIGAARVVADYDITAEDAAAYAAFNATVDSFNTTVFSRASQLNPVNGPVDYTVGGVAVFNFGAFNEVVINGDNQTRVPRTAPDAYNLVFQLWQNKELVFSRTVSDSAIFRCPAGYKSDTFEVSVSGSARVRAIHLGETPHGLREA
jgi:hypothetical protein